ncbi:MAG: DUF4118 domain-containing protein [Acidimicrobiales bacterium]
MTSTIPRPARRPRHRPETFEPGERARLPHWRKVLAYVAAIALPIGICVASIPLRSDHGPTIAVVLLACVIIIAAFSAAGPAVTAATTAAAAYDFFLTQPHYSLAIHDNDEAVTTLTLLVVGLVAGVLASRGIRLQANATTRKAELDHLIDFASTAADAPPDEHLTAAACQHLTALLDLSDCTWKPGPASQDDTPILLPSGDTMGYLRRLNPDRARLPSRLELPAIARGQRAGSFLIAPRGIRLTSHEERRTAAAIATLYAATQLDP